MTDEQRARLTAMSMIGRPVKFRRKDRGGHWTVGVVEDEVYEIVSDYKHMIQRIRFRTGVSWDGSEYGYRTGYYTYDAKGKRIVWGQYTQFLTEHEYQRLLGKARDRGWQIS
jgi:hypothetical protein